MNYPLERWTALLLFLAAPAGAAVVTVCAAGPPRCQFRTAQAAIDAASFGDVIQLQAGETFAGFRLRYKPGAAAAPVVITTTRDADLPRAGTRITPAYAMGPHPVTARVRGAGGEPTITTDNGMDACPRGHAACPAHGYVLRGLEIIAGRNPYVDVAIGPEEGTLRDIQELPYDITLDRDYIHAERFANLRRCVTPHGRDLTIENSWIADCHERGADSQAIESWSSPGPLKILNNYLEASTEIVSFGGALPILSGVLMQNAEIAFNQFHRPDFYLSGREPQLHGVWQPSRFYEAGKFILPPRSNGFQYLARQGGASGTAEPAWPTKPGATVRDGGIVWECQPDVAGTRWLVKNLLESKSSDGLNIHHNLFENSPAAAQSAALVLTVRTGQSGHWARVWHTVVEDNLIRDAAAVLNTLGADNEDPSLRLPWRPHFRFGGGARIVPSAGLAAGRQYRAAGDCTSGDTEPAWPASPGSRVSDGACAWMAEPLSAGAWVWKPDGNAGTTRDIRFRNNLAYRIGRGYGQAAADDTTPVIGLSQAVSGIVIDHNTFDHRNATFITGAGLPGFGSALRDNLIAPTPYGMSAWTYDRSADLSGCRFLNYWFCNDPASAAYPDRDAACPAGRAVRNVMSGYAVDGAAACSRNDAIPAGNWDAAWDKVGLDGDFALRPHSRFVGKAADRTDVGADVSRLPLIRDLRVEPGDRRAALRYEVTPAISRIPCVLRVSTRPDFADSIPDVDPTLYRGADAMDRAGNLVDGLRRLMNIGTRQPLEPGATYWYWLACGGDARIGSFQARTAAH